VVKSSDGKLEAKLDPPKETGGKGEGTNPEQLFAAGYAACFIGAMKFIAGTQKIVLKDGSIDSSVNCGPLANGGKGIGVDMVIHLPGLEREQAEKLVHDAHEVCPYSNATRGNIDVNPSVA
jgi:osmotically inducible protein OsmC